MNRKKLVLFITLILFILSLGYAYIRMPREATVAQLKNPPGGTRGVTAKVDAASPVDEKKLHLELLDRGPVASSGFRRNIFHPIFQEELKVPSLPPPPPPPKLPPVPPPPPGPAEPHGPVLPPPVETPSYIKDMAAFTFLGFLKEGGRRTVFLSRNNEIFLARKGGKIGDKYEVTNVTDDALTIKVLAEGREIIIPLEENKVLTPARP